MTNARSLFLTFLIVGPLFAYFVFIAPARNRVIRTEPAAAAPPVARTVPNPAERTHEAGHDSDPVKAEAGRYLDYSEPFPWFPRTTASLSPEAHEAMEKLRAMRQYDIKPLKPGGAKTTMATLDMLEKRVADTLALSETAGGVVTGRAIVFTGEAGKPIEDKSAPANFAGDFYPLLNDAAKAYTAAPDAAVTARAEELLRRLLTHFSNQPLDGLRGPAKGVWMGNGYVWRSADGGMARRMLAVLPLLKAPASRANFLENLIWMQLGVGAQQTSRYSIDDHGNVTPQCLATIAQMQDCPAKWQRLIMLRHALETSIVPNDKDGINKDGRISPDGGVIHHNYAHNAYAFYHFAPMCQLLRDLSDCGVPSLCDPDEVARRVARAGIAWAWIHQPGKCVTNIEGRPTPPFVAQREAIARPGADDFVIAAARTLISYKRPATWREDATHLLATAMAKNPATKIPSELQPLLDAAKQVADPLSGSLAYPISGAILQRRDNWLASVRGAPPGRTGGEGMPYGPWGTRITFGGLYCKGSLMLVGDGASPGAPPDLVSSGHAIEGRDMSLMPGVTAPILPWEKMVGSWHGSGAKFSAPVAIGGQGVWGFATGAAVKSCFLFDNCITYATVLVPPPVAPAKKTTAPAVPLATTFIQFRHADGTNDPEFFDGKPFAPGAHVSLADNQPHTLLGTGGHGYYLHPTTESLELFRREQENHLCETPKGSIPVDKGKDARKPRPEVAVAYKGDFTTGYWLHDTKATQPAPVVFTLIVKSGEAGLANFANRMKDPKTAPARFTHSPTAHILYNAHKDMWGAVFFAAGERGPGHELNATCPLLATDRPCSVAMKGNKTALTLAVSGGEEIKAPAPFTLTLKGRWRLAGDMDPNAATAQLAPSGVETRLVVAPAAPAGNPVSLVAL